MMSSVPTPASEHLKEAFQAALAAQDWLMAIEIGGQMKKGAFSFMEQIDLLLLLSLLDAQTATKLLYTNAFSNTFVMIGLTLPNVTSLSSSPYFIPSMEVELKQAVIERRMDDAAKIRQCGQWCISSKVLEEIDELERQLLSAPIRCYLRLQAATTAPVNVTNNVPTANKLARRFTK